MFKVGDRVQKIANGPLAMHPRVIAPIGACGVICSIGKTSPDDMQAGYSIAVKYDGIDAVQGCCLPCCVATPQMLRKLDDAWAKDKVAYAINSQDALIGTDKRDLLVTK